MTLAITFCSSVVSCPYRFHDMLVRSVALLIDAIGFKLYVRKFVDAFGFVVLYCIVVYFFLFLLFLSLGDEIKLLTVLDRDPAPPQIKGPQQPVPSFWPMSVVATVAHLSYC